ncbi:MAG: hypothetical protein GTO55_04145, partial [Armatimonadetes bacterium]|nr:hypothetical protein [Armatimonadota bacterium]NIM23462.1 hypothetical protein [Armatimonadota bacterium]NIM67328.1 hypothetical protein [Armatimonadota bacterium]NIM75825.1 hypothetical protein [Armatimonadota bacterium]NIN05513.1 hypothetical protein [Armatimonadota bacterium]
MTSLSLKSLCMVATRNTVVCRHSGLLLLALVLILTSTSLSPATSAEEKKADSDKQAIPPGLELVPASGIASSNGKDLVPGIAFQSEKLRFEIGHRKKDQSSFHLGDAEAPASIEKNYGQGKKNPLDDGDTQASIEYDISPGLILVGEYHSKTGPDKGEDGAQNKVRTKQAIEWKRGGTTASFALSRAVESSSWGKQTDSKLSTQDFSVQHEFNTSSFLRSIAFRHTATVSEVGENVTDKNITKLQIVSSPFRDASLNLDYTLRANTSGEQSTKKISFDSGSALGKNFRLKGYRKIDKNTAGANANKTSLNLDGDLSSTSVKFKLKGLYETGLSQTGDTDDKAQVKFQSAFGSGKTKVAFDGDILRHNSAKTSGNNQNNKTRLSLAAVGNPRLQIEAAYKQTLKGIADAVESFRQTDVQLTSEVGRRTTLLASFVQTDNLPAFHQTIHDLRIQNDRQTAKLSVGMQQLADATGQQSAAPYFRGHLDLGRQLPEWASETALIGSFSEPLPPALTKLLEAQGTNDLFPKVKNWGYLKTPSWFATKGGIDVSWKAPSLTGNKP